MTKQCPSCGGICKPSGCEREHVTQTCMNSRKWQGLTDEEITKAGHLNVEGERMLPYSFARAIEARLKEKNV